MGSHTGKFTCEISYVKFHMWNFTLDISHVKSHTWKVLWNILHGNIFTSVFLKPAVNIVQWRRTNTVRCKIDFNWQKKNLLNITYQSRNYSQYYSMVVKVIVSVNTRVVFMVWVADTSNSNKAFRLRRVSSIKSAGLVLRRYFNFFLGEAKIFFYFLMPLDCWKIGRNSTLYVVIWRHS